MFGNKDLIGKIVEVPEGRAYRPRFARLKEPARKENVLAAVRRLAKVGSVKKHRAGLAAGVRASAEFQQRVVIKSRIVKMEGKGKALAVANIKYITRDSVGIDGGQAKAFNSSGVLDEKSLQEFTGRGADIRHQFRFIVSPEHGDKVEMESFVLDLMKVMEKDLKTKLDYVAVVHYDTDNPHAHMVVNGMDAKGNDLVISRDYISQGMRSRASTILTHELGLRSEQDITQQKEQEVGLEKVTSLDRKIVNLSDKKSTVVIKEKAEEKIVDVATLQGKNIKSTALLRGKILGRLGKLESLGLSVKVKPNLYRIDGEFIDKLRSLETRNVLVNRVQQFLTEMNEKFAQKDIILLHQNPQVGVSLSEPISGKVIGKGLVNELYDKKYIILSATDGKIYYAPLSLYSEKEGSLAKQGDIVTLGKLRSVLPSKIDQNIVRVAKSQGGVYSQEQHYAVLASKPLPAGLTADAYITSHVKRLEVLVARNVVEKLPSGAYRVPADFAEKLVTYEKQQVAKYMPVTIESRLTLQEQIQAKGMTWLDRCIIEGNAPTSTPSAPQTAFQRELSTALERRVEVLVKAGLIERSAPALLHETVSSSKSLTVPANLGEKLLAMEMQEAAKPLTKDYGFYRSIDEAPVMDNKKVWYGTLEKVMSLPSGKYGIIDLGNGFTLVPIQNGMEKLIGKPIEISIPQAKSITSFDQKLGRTRVSFASRENTLDRGLGL